MIGVQPIAVAIMMAMMAVVSSTPVIPAVSVATVVIRIWLGIRVVRSPIVPIRVIIIGCGTSVIAARKSEADSPNSGKCGRDLSVGTLRKNESQSAYR